MKMLFKKSPEKILENKSPFDAIFSLIDRIPKKKDFSAYTNAERILWCLNLLYKESENGTIEQYAANSSGDLFAETLLHLEILGSHNARTALDELNRILDGRMTATRNERIAAIDAARSADEAGFEKKIRALTNLLDWEEIFSAAVAYLREHKDELV